MVILFGSSGIILICLRNHDHAKAKTCGCGGCHLSYAQSRERSPEDLPQTTAEDYDAFIQVVGEGLQKYDVELFSFTLMPNHWHLVGRPGKDGELGRMLRWVTATHTLRYHAHITLSRTHYVITHTLRYHAHNTLSRTLAHSR